MPKARVRRDLSRLRELATDFQTVHADGPPVFETLLPRVREILGLESGLIYGVRQVHGRFNLERLIEDRFAVPHNRLVTALAGMVDAAPLRWGLFNPACPEPQQRNRSLLHAPLDQLVVLSPQWRRGYGLSRRDEASFAAEGLGRMFEPYGKMGIRALWQLRVLVCERESLLAWVGGFSEARPSEEAPRLLNALVPAIRERLLLERLLDRGPLLEASLAATLEAIPRSAFLATQAGVVLEANSAGQALWNREPAATRRAICEAVQPGGASGPFQRTEVAAAGRRSIFLLVRRREELGGRQRAFLESVARAAKDFGLSPREAQVFACVVRGLSNKETAQELACAIATVELHVTHLLHKSGAASRTQLTARFWSDP